MMRGASNWAVAIRKPDGDIAQVSRPVQSAMARHWVLRLPVIRGVVALGESLTIGFRALAISAHYAAQEERADGDEAAAEEIETELSRGALIFAFAIAIGFALILFKVTPALITDWIGIKAGWFVIVARVRSASRSSSRTWASSRYCPTSGASSSTTPPSTRRSTPTRRGRSSSPSACRSSA